MKGAVKAHTFAALLLAGALLAPATAARAETTAGFPSYTCGGLLSNIEHWNYDAFAMTAVDRHGDFYAESKGRNGDLDPKTRVRAHIHDKGCFEGKKPVAKLIGPAVRIHLNGIPSKDGKKLEVYGLGVY